MYCPLGKPAIFLGKLCSSTLGGKDKVTVRLSASRMWLFKAKFMAVPILFNSSNWSSLISIGLPSLGQRSKVTVYIEYIIAKFSIIVLTLEPKGTSTNAENLKPLYSTHVMSMVLTSVLIELLIQRTTCNSWRLTVFVYSMIVSSF